MQYKALHTKATASDVTFISKRERIRYVCYMPSQIRLSVVCLSVTLVHTTQAVELFGNFFTIR